MSRRLLIYFLLAVFFNSMFFPEGRTDGNTAYDISRTIDEINTLVEFVNHHCLNIKDASPEDEDDDVPDPAKLHKLRYYCNPTICSIYIPIPGFRKNAFIFHEDLFQENHKETSYLPPESSC